VERGNLVAQGIAGICRGVGCVCADYDRIVVAREEEMNDIETLYKNVESLFGRYKDLKKIIFELNDELEHLKIAIAVTLGVIAALVILRVI
jgi:hypothetical protein